MEDIQRNSCHFTVRAQSGLSLAEHLCFHGVCTLKNRPIGIGSALRPGVITVNHNSIISSPPTPNPPSYFILCDGRRNRLVLMVHSPPPSRPVFADRSGAPEPLQQDLIPSQFAFRSSHWIKHWTEVCKGGPVSPERTVAGSGGKYSNSSIATEQLLYT
jgi:hypothetical protein